MVTKIPQADMIPKRARELAKEWAELYRINLLEQVQLATKTIQSEYTDEDGKAKQVTKEQHLDRDTRRALLEAGAHEIAFQKTVGEVAIRFASQEMDFTIVKMNAEVVARRYDDVVDERLIPSKLAETLLTMWEDCDCEYPNACTKGHGLEYKFPEHERAERKARLERYISMMQRLEDKYDHGKIEPPTQ